MPQTLIRALALFGLILGFGTASAQVDYGGRAPNVLIVDYATGQVLLERNADIALPPASMSKLVTLALLFDALRDGRVQMDTQWSVSARAHAMGGSRMFLERRDRPTTEDLIRGIAILSGNDATVVVAEGLAGSEEAFATLATQWAHDRGMRDTSIANSSGWPDPNHRMSLRDLVTLSRYLLEEHPEYYHYLGEDAFTWNGITQPNRVPLLGAGLGLDGLKTGHTNEAGFALAGSAIQGTRRVLFAFSGLADAPERTREAEAIINWSFRQFVEVEVVPQGRTLADAPVWLGAADSVPLVAPAAVRVLVPTLGAGEISARVDFMAPLAAPLTAGTEVGRLIVTVPGQSDLSFPVVTGADVAEGGFLPRMRGAAIVLAGHLGLATP
jgi:D-alanyl-D-alanine carboxypeptidase (penicillin-binding protein 5/6)